MGAGIPKLHKLLYGALWVPSGHPMVWDYPQFPHRAEPKALNLLQTGTLWHTLIGLLSYPILSYLTLTYVPLWATLWEVMGQT